MMSTRPKGSSLLRVLTGTLVGWFVMYWCRGDGFMVVVLFCRGDSFEEDMRCWAGGFVDLVELDDEVDVGVTLRKTVEAVRGAFFFSTSIELNTKGLGEGQLAAK